MTRGHPSPRTLKASPRSLSTGACPIQEARLLRDRQAVREPKLARQKERQADGRTAGRGVENRHQERAPWGLPAQPAADYIPVSPVNPQEQTHAQLSPAQIPDPQNSGPVLGKQQ